MLLWAGAIKNIKSFLGQLVAGMRMGVLGLENTFYPDRNPGG